VRAKLKSFRLVGGGLLLFTELPRREILGNPLLLAGRKSSGKKRVGTHGGGFYRPIHLSRRLPHRSTKQVPLVSILGAKRDTSALFIGLPRRGVLGNPVIIYARISFGSRTGALVRWH